jgi:hypothetical protein
MVGAMLLGVVMGARVRGADGPGAATQPAAKAIVSQVEAWAAAIGKTDAEAAFPGLRKDAEAWAKGLHDAEVKAAATQPGEVVVDYHYVGVVTEKAEPVLARYLNFWNRSDFGVGEGVNYYPPGSFDKITPAMEKGNAYVVFREGKTLVVYWFLRMKAGEPWRNASRAELQAAARVGAALALLQDGLEAVRAGKPVNTVPAAAGVKWTWGNPVMWMLMAQDTHGGPQGLFVWQEGLSPEKREALLGAWVREDNERNLAVEFHLRQTGAVAKYMGWEIAGPEKVSEPMSEPVREPGK